MNTFMKLSILYAVLLINADKLARATPLALGTIEEALQPAEGSPATEVNKDKERRDVQLQLDANDNWDHHKQIDPLELGYNSEDRFQNAESKHFVEKRVLTLPFSDERVYG
ncbi:unnamed protein product [Orchesella dallaii]|uniref:Uncharacterized protein n=1 Tax=Orchesella dallaii TaxID=48710 RepID=A0ABP1PXQ2_9HEXA